MSCQYRFRHASRRTKLAGLTRVCGPAGSHTALSLLEEGYKVVIIDNLDNAFPEVYSRMQKLAGDKASQMTFVKVRLKISFHANQVYLSFLSLLPPLSPDQPLPMSPISGVTDGTAADRATCAPRLTLRKSSWPTSTPQAARRSTAPCMLGLVLYMPRLTQPQPMVEWKIVIVILPHLS